MLLTQFAGKAQAVIPAEPADVFAALTDVGRLPDWNTRIAKIIEPPSGPLGPGVEWVVKMSVPPASWPSRARVVKYDPGRLEFLHISQSDDGNPSYVEWRWTIAPESDGARVTVEWFGRPKTFWRRLLFARLRRSQLGDEVPASLAALARHVSSHHARV
jgi:uncharacterized protein YndB with AHSA1/START domain